MQRLVQVSSPSVAHAGSSLVGAPAGPADPATARGPYARTKAQSELEALAADQTGEVPLAVVAVRPHIVWGPGDTQLVERVVDRGRAGRLPLLGTGAALVDTTYVDNAVDALVAALEQQYDAYTRGAERSLLAGDEADLPSGDELGAELERFLAEQSRGGDGGQTGGGPAGGPAGS